MTNTEDENVNLIIREIVGKDHYEDVLDSLVARTLHEKADALERLNGCTYAPLARENAIRTINEEGFDRQIKYLLRSGVTVDDIITFLQAAYEHRMEMGTGDPCNDGTCPACFGSKEG